MKPTAADVLLILGLVSIGTGLFFWFNLGVALTIVGAILLFLGIAANVAANMGPKKR